MSSTSAKDKRRIQKEIKARVTAFQALCVEACKSKETDFKILYKGTLVAIICTDGFIHYKSTEDSEKINTGEWLSTMKNRIKENNGQPFFPYVVMNHYAQKSTIVV